MSSGKFLSLSLYLYVLLPIAYSRGRVEKKLRLGLGFISPHSIRVSHTTMHIFHSTAIVYVQVYEFLHVFVVEFLGKPNKSTEPGPRPGQPAVQPAGLARSPVNRMADRPVRSLVRLDRTIRRVAQFFAQLRQNT
jgi:hypothetical protein